VINLSSTVKIALRAIRVNKMRSALTMLGIIIGVGAVITMISVGSGAKQRISEQISSMGSNLILVLSGATTQGGIRFGAGTQPTLTIGDAVAIQEECPSVQYSAPAHRTTAQVVYSNQNWSTAIIGTTPEMLYIREWELSDGRNLTPDDIRSAAKVCLLGKTVMENLFGNINPMGQVIRIKNVPFMVVGVLRPKGQSPSGDDQDDVIYIPITTAQKKIAGTQFPGSVKSIMVKARSSEDLMAAERQITELLRQRHRLGPRQENDFTVRNLTQMMEAQEQSAQVMTLLLAAIASVSLIVGGIGIMNIMLVSVTERTREIGIRMAVGAKTWDIRLQFIVEALTLSVIGGLIGILIGIGASEIISVTSGWSILISPFSVLLAFGFSVLVGVFFGFYPAYKASMLKPIEALRYE